MLSLYERAARNEATSRPPIWMMRQAGRYLPEYRALREKYSFLQMMRTPELATEITLQPIRRFGFDAAILFSDILVTASALGSDLDFVEKKGPVISNPIRTLQDVQALQIIPAEQSIYYVMDAIKLLLPELKATGTPLIGFCGAPFTVASYMIEGGSSADLTRTKQMIGNDPACFQALMDVLTDISISYLNAQIKAGVQALQIFDTWAGLLSWADFNTFIIPSLRRLIEGLDNPNQIPISVFSRSTSTFGPVLSKLPIQVLSVDWQSSLPDLRSRLRQDLAIQGNLDPGLLLADPRILKARVLNILNDMHPFKGFIFNLGHGITPNVNPDHVKCVVDTVQNY